MVETRRWVTRTEAADMLGVTPQTIDKYAREGRLRRYRSDAGQTRYRIEDVEARRRALTEFKPDDR